MSKIGRRPIELTSAKVEIKKEGEIEIKGPKASFTHKLPEEIEASLKDGKLIVSLKKMTKKSNELWGLHRALLANKVKGVETGFEKKVKIVGLGYKAQLSGKKLIFSLGYSHKIDFELPENVAVDVDKTGQNLIFKSSDKLALGNVCDSIRSLRPPEPYKGTGIILEGERIIRKAGKAKTA
ncbi:50S ribosomal protein L6 [Candidatus Dependentiae bacterium]|nr:50S ribosomal protein L6 [Candidatus Dependentiae bacterium]